MALSHQEFSWPKLCLLKIKLKFKKQEISHKSLEILASFEQMEDTKLTLCVVADGWSWGWGAATPVDGHWSCSSVPTNPRFLAQGKPLRHFLCWGQPWVWKCTELPSHLRHITRILKIKRERLNTWYYPEKESLAFCVQNFLVGMAFITPPGTPPTSIMEE